MTVLPRSSLTLVLLITCSILFSGCAQEQARTSPDDTDSVTVNLPTENTPVLSDTGTFRSDVPFVESPQPIVNKMLELAKVDEDDVVYDLGSGDGRIVISAAKDFGANGVGVEIKPELVAKAQANAKKAGVADRVEFRQGDLFEADISEATVVTLYLLPSVNMKLRPKLFQELSPGTRVVSHDFDMNEWQPDTTWESGGETVHRWTIPEEPPAFVDLEK